VKDHPQYLIEALEEGHAEARRRFAELLALDPASRRRQAVGARLCDLQVAELLLEASRRALPAALLVAGDTGEAEAAFRIAAFHLTGPPSSFERAFYCLLLAPLRRLQARPDEATALLWRAVVLCGEIGAEQDLGAALASLGLAYLDEDDPGRALPPLRQAAALLDGSRWPELAGRARLRLAEAEATFQEPVFRRHEGAGAHEPTGGSNMYRETQKKKPAVATSGMSGRSGIDEIRLPPIRDKLALRCFEEEQRTRRLAEKLKAERVQDRLKAERVQKLLQGLPGWSLAPGGVAIDRAREFPEPKAAASFAAFVRDLAGAAVLPVDVFVAGTRVLVTVQGRPRAGCDPGLGRPVFDLARQIG
jgi:hypothetical protein